MTINSFEQHLVEAETAVQAGNWQSAIRALKQAELCEPTHTGVLTALGTCSIQSGEVRNAVGFFEKVAELAPEAFEAHNNLGVAHTLAAQYAKAEQAFRNALQIDGENLATWKNLAQACLEQNDRLTEGVTILASLVKTHPEDDGVLVMMGNVYEDSADLSSAEVLFQQALKINTDNPDAADGLKRVAEARARQARIARPEHAKKLAALKGLKKASAETAAMPPVENLQPVGPFSPDVKNVIFYALEDTQGYVQAAIQMRKLAAAGRKARVSCTFDAADLAGQDLLVFSQPNLSGDFIKAINHCLQHKQAYAVVLDQDYHHIPQDHPAYSQVGPGNPESLKALETILGEAQFVMVPSTVLAERYRTYCKKIAVVAPEIDRENLLWNRPRQPHQGFRIGWIGSAADRPDLLSIKKALLSFMRATPEAVLVIAGDEGAYAKFGAIDESRRLFLPAAGAGEIPYLLGQFDVLIVPQRDTPFNQAKSALPLLEAEARGIPWVASRMPAFEECTGGVLVKTVEEWQSELAALQGSN